MRIINSGSIDGGLCGCRTAQGGYAVHRGRRSDRWLYDLNVVWWRFLTPTQRAERAPSLEAMLRGRLDAAVEPGLKSTWFAALRDVATMPETVAWLRALWQRQATIPSLPLVGADETSRAYALALRGVEGTRGLLDAKRDRITNPDSKARFEFMRGAVSPDAGERERWFRALSDPANRRRETCVVEGLRPLNDPLWADTSAALVPKALVMLWDIQRTGALCFDANWVNAVLRGIPRPGLRRSSRASSAPCRRTIHRDCAPKFCKPRTY